MKSEDKKMIKDIMHNKDLDKNLLNYAKGYTNAVYQYALIHFVLNYYTLKEVEEDTGGISIDDTLNGVMDDIHTILYEALLAKDIPFDVKDRIETMKSVRNMLTKKMIILTAYTDALQLYEYILNRIEYRLTGETYEVDEQSLSARVFRYLFQDADKMVINSKIQLVTGQLPIRMTKNKFYDYLTDTLNIYNGSERSSLDDFVERLKSTALLETPDGYKTEYQEIANLIGTLEELDFKEMDLQTYQAVMEQFAFTANHLTELVSNYLLVTELVNNFYAFLLLLPFQKEDTETISACVSMLSGIHASFLNGGSIPDSVNEEFMKIEGVQEQLGEDIVGFESVLFDIMDTKAEQLEFLCLDKQFECLSLTSKLMSNSLFIDLEKQTEEELPADSDYILKKRDELVAILSKFFDENKKEMNRAVMASLFSSMPVLFNSQEEVKNYIEHSLTNCNNESELMACAKILDDLMAEE